MLNAFRYFNSNNFKWEKYSIFYPMLESNYPFTSSAGDDSTDCHYSASKAINVEV